MGSVTRIPRYDDRETAEQVRAQFGAIVVAYFLRAIDSLNQLPPGPGPAARNGWTRPAPRLTAGSSQGTRQAPH
jgi:hypothetical protein